MVHGLRTKITSEVLRLCLDLHFVTFGAGLAQLANSTVVTKSGFVVLSEDEINLILCGKVQN